jgi:hypothetical protein
VGRKFKPYDIIIPNNGSCMGVVKGYDEKWYFVTWVAGGDSMLCIEPTDKNMVKVGEYVPGSVDDILLFGKMTT